MNDTATMKCENHQWFETKHNGKKETFCETCGIEKAHEQPKESGKAVGPVDNTPYGIIERSLRTQPVTERVRLALGHLTPSTGAKNEAFKYIASVLSEIQKTVGLEPKKDLSLCTPDSVIQAMVDAASHRLPIDGRRLAYLVKYGNRAQFQPGYKGLLFKISEIFNDADFTAEPVFEGDELTLSDNGGFQSYTHKRPNPFQADIKNMIGIVACLSYSTGNHRHSKVVAMPKDEVEKIRTKAKTDAIWKEWFYEMAKGAALKRLCKIHFTSALGLQELAQYDNDEHYDLSPKATDITPEKPTEKLNEILEGKAATL